MNATYTFRNADEFKSAYRRFANLTKYAKIRLIFNAEFPTGQTEAVAEALGMTPETPVFVAQYHTANVTGYAVFMYNGSCKLEYISIDKLGLPHHITETLQASVGKIVRTVKSASCYKTTIYDRSWNQLKSHIN